MILLFTDLHLDNYRKFSTTLKSGVNSRLATQIKVVSDVWKIAMERKPTAIVFLGDLFNGQGATISKTLYNAGHRLVLTLSRVAPVYLLVGNHDIYGDICVTEPMNTIKNVTVVEETIDVEIDGLKLTMVPWCGMLPKGGDIVLGHLDIDGAKTGSGYVLEGTIHPNELTQPLVISGHFHSRQQLSDNILYCGAVMANDFGDSSDEQFGVTLLHPDRTTEFIEITSPRFVPVEITTQEDVARFIENRDVKNYYKLVVHDRKLDIPKMNHLVEIEWDIKEEIKGRLEYEPDEPLEDIIIKYIDKMDVQVDKDEAKSILLEVLNEVS